MAASAIIVPFIYTNDVHIKVYIVTSYIVYCVLADLRSRFFSKNQTSLVPILAKANAQLLSAEENVKYINSLRVWFRLTALALLFPFFLVWLSLFLRKSRFTNIVLDFSFGLQNIILEIIHGNISSVLKQLINPKNHFKYIRDINRMIAKSTVDDIYTLSYMAIVFFIVIFIDLIFSFQEKSAMKKVENYRKVIRKLFEDIGIAASLLASDPNNKFVKLSNDISDNINTTSNHKTSKKSNGESKLSTPKERLEDDDDINFNNGNNQTPPSSDDENDGNEDDFHLNSKLFTPKFHPESVLSPQSVNSNISQENEPDNYSDLILSSPETLSNHSHHSLNSNQSNLSQNSINSHHSILSQHSIDQSQLNDNLRFNEGGPLTRNRFRRREANNHE